jgi:hypothetical protein
LAPVPATVLIVQCVSAIVVILPLMPPWLSPPACQA